MILLDTDHLSVVTDRRDKGHAAEKFKELRRAGVRIGPNDLKIASLAITNDALLLTRNARDFSRVPGLRFENWLE